MGSSPAGPGRTPAPPEPPGAGWLQDPRHCHPALTPLVLANGRLGFLLSPPPPGSPVDPVCSLVNLEGQSETPGPSGDPQRGGAGGGGRHVPLGSEGLARGWLPS